LNYGGGGNAWVFFIEGTVALTKGIGAG